MRSTLSIRAFLTLFTTAFVVIALGLAVYASLRLVEIQSKTAAVGKKWLPSMQTLYQLDDRVTEFRMSEIYRALAPDQKTKDQIESTADDHRRAIEYLEDDYATALGQSHGSDLDPFRLQFTAYLAQHDAWTGGRTSGAADMPARNDSASQRLFQSTVDSIDRQIDRNKSEARTAVNEAAQIVHNTLLAMLAISGAATLFAVWILVCVRQKITGPLGAITQALSSLAAGNRDVRVPEVNRSDEIGDMAKAFDVFRANALALEHAHEATQAAQEQAQALARHDPMTGLPNRRVLFGDLESAVARAKQGSTICSVLMVDLDRFKPINDLQGHPVGDLVLCEVARRLREAEGKNHTVARLGGDEFAIIIETDVQSHREAVLRLAGKVLTDIREPITAAESRVEISASIGIASCPDDGDDPESLLRAADIAMYRAKRDGSDTFRFFEQSMDEELRGRASLETDFRTALAAGEIEPHYQPLVDMRDRSIYGFEMLARWQHTVRGSVPPDVFIPIAEHLGLIGDLTWSILRRACRDAKEWPESITVALNVSPMQLRDPAFPTQILAILNQEGFSPERLEIEITETALISDIETAKLVLRALKLIGIKVSLDDFGTGYSSLYHLRELKFDKIKIDRSFVQSMPLNSESEKIVDAILSLAKSLGLPTVAEGIESTDVLGKLATMGCDFGQGYYFGKAMTAEKASELLGEHKKDELVA
ncbi:EAL domain-containing protein [Mesorhizobium loti]|nr:EAL domain-containing protein [Mesorhizobium loti]